MYFLIWHQLKSRCSSECLNSWNWVAEVSETIYNDKMQRKSQKLQNCFKKYFNIFLKYVQYLKSERWSSTMGG